MSKTLIENYEEAYEKCGQTISEQKDMKEVRFFARLAGENEKSIQEEYFKTMPFSAEPSRPKIILDIGCAEGQLSLELVRRGHMVTAMDISKSYVNRATSLARKWNVPLVGIVADVESMKEDGMESLYDVVYLMDVIEHLRNPSAALANIRKCLDDDGMLIINTPNTCNLRKIAGYLIRPKRMIDLSKPGMCSGLHLQEYDYSTLNQLLAFGGFRIKKVVPRSWKSRMFPKLGKDLTVICEKAEPLDAERIIGTIGTAKPIRKGAKNRR